MHILDFPYFLLFASKNIVAMTYDSTLVISVFRNKYLCAIELVPVSADWKQVPGNFVLQNDNFTTSRWLV